MNPLPPSDSADSPEARMGAARRPTVIVDANPPSAAPTPRTWSGVPAGLVTGDSRLDYARPYAVLGGAGT
ncbi:hypothetical protein, partial [Corynebacterium heidelbergense]|uniref:hypothetical protein n=1 Tax=Corynebacterium heidelbergense TaxID=2055947 RepID=UPI0019310230